MSAPIKRFSRRRFLGTVGATVVGVGEVAATAGVAENKKPDAPDASTPNLRPGISDGPSSPRFTPVSLAGNTTLKALEPPALSPTLRRNAQFASDGDCVCWGIPFHVDRVAMVRGEPLALNWPAVRAPWLVCMHTTDVESPARNSHGLITASRGLGRLNEHVADYVFLFADGTEVRAAIRRRHQIGMLSRVWVHNRLHRHGVFHDHPPATDHPEHHSK